MPSEILKNLETLNTTIQCFTIHMLNAMRKLKVLSCSLLLYDVLDTQEESHMIIYHILKVKEDGTPDYFIYKLGYASSFVSMQIRNAVPLVQKLSQYVHVLCISLHV